MTNPRPADGSSQHDSFLEAICPPSGSAGEADPIGEMTWRPNARLHRLQPIEVRRLIWEGCALLDARGLEEFTSGHLEGASLLSPEAPESEIRRLLPDPEHPIVCYSGGNRRARILGQRLISLGYLHVFTLQEGISQFLPD